MPNKASPKTTCVETLRMPSRFIVFSFGHKLITHTVAADKGAHDRPHQFSGNRCRAYVAVAHGPLWHLPGDLLSPIARVCLWAELAAAWSTAPRTGGNRPKP